MLKTIFTTIFVLLVSISVRAVEVGAPSDVAPGVKDTLNQTWPSIAWSKDSKCWLVVWREGYLNEKVTDIWCARISADGKSMDPNGICVSKGVTGVKDRPRVASDGKDFFIVWEDFRNGKDWDVYAARVSGAGEILDKESVLFTGGAHNQCLPDVEFAKGRYCVLWMSFVEGRYCVYGTSLAPADKPVAGKVEDVIVLKRRDDRSTKEGVLPVITADGSGNLLSACLVASGRNQGRRYLTVNVIDPQTGGRVGELKKSPQLKNLKKRVVPAKLGWYRERRAAVAVGAGEVVTVTSGEARVKSKDDLSVCRFSKTGELLGIQELGSTLTIDSDFKPLMPRPAVVFDGKSYLVISDCLTYLGANRTYPDYRVRLIGWQLSPDGTVKDADGFLVAGDDGFECMLPAVAVGPEGVSLVVYSEIRGMDDAKVLARIIK